MEPEYNNRPVKVEFPRNMEVHSPELDAVKESTKSIVNILTNNLQNIARDIQALTKLPKLFAELKTLVANQFSNLFQAQVESEIMNRQANIKVLGKKIGFVESHINKKEDQLKKTNEQISNRFVNVSKELTKENELFLSKLDSHAYSITEQIYPKQIKEKFSFDIQPNIDYLVNHTAENAYLRTKCLSDSYLDSKKQVDNFLLERNMFYNSIEKYGVKTNLEDDKYKLSAWVYKLKNNETGEVETKFIFPWTENKQIVNCETELEEILIGRLESSNLKKTAKTVSKKEIQDVLTDFKIPQKEQERLFNDCKNVLMEDVI